MNEREANDTNAKIHRLMDTIAEQQREIERLKKVVGAYEKLLTAYRCGGRTPERALDLISNYKAAEAAKGEK